jgi:hypothetical protein
MQLTKQELIETINKLRKKIDTNTNTDTELVLYNKLVIELRESELNKKQLLMD